MRISDWSSDVCSSDLRIFYNLFTGHAASAVTNAMAREEERKRAEVRPPPWLQHLFCYAVRTRGVVCFYSPWLSWTEPRPSSEVRRGGKECVSECKYRWSAYM